MNWHLTGVYGPQGEAEKLAFIQELRSLASSQGPNWLVFGDFNLIYRAADKNNNLLNRRLMGSFKRALNLLSLRELRLTRRRFMWSNEPDNPTLTKIDRFFCTSDWDLAFPSATVQALPAAVSDHSPPSGHHLHPQGRLFPLRGFLDANGGLSGHRQNGLGRAGHLPRQGAVSSHQARTHATCS